MNGSLLCAADVGGASQFVVVQYSLIQNKDVVRPFIGTYVPCSMTSFEILK